MNKLTPQTVEQVVEAVQSNERLIPFGALSKPALSLEYGPASPDTTRICLTELNGILEYEPTEFTFTAMAGTPISSIQKALGNHGQYLPFDPPQSRQATLGGAVASGLNGSCSLRYGGIRDFILGIKFVDGHGRLITGGGKVVKNAAGFDLPKFMVGSCGRFGILTELTLKVFPSPENYSTLCFAGDLQSHLNCIQQLLKTPMEFDAIDLDSEKLWIRIGGNDQSFSEQTERIIKLTGQRPAVEIKPGPAESQLWDNAAHFKWATDDSSLVKIACQIDDVADVVSSLQSVDAAYRICLGGQLIYASIQSDSILGMQKNLKTRRLSLQVIRGNSAMPPFEWTPFARRIKNAIDPKARFWKSENEG